MMKQASPSHKFEAALPSPFLRSSLVQSSSFCRNIIPYNYPTSVYETHRICPVFCNPTVRSREQHFNLPISVLTIPSQCYVHKRSSRTRLPEPRGRRGKTPPNNSNSSRSAHKPPRTSMSSIKTSTSLLSGRSTIQHLLLHSPNAILLRND
jgi:hypothetical protein